MSEPLTLSVAEAAERLGVGHRWLANQARAGHVPCRRLGRRLRFTEADIDAILTASAHGAPIQANPWKQAPRSRRRAQEAAS